MFGFQVEISFDALIFHKLEITQFIYVFYGQNGHLKDLRHSDRQFDGFPTNLVSSLIDGIKAPYFWEIQKRP